MRALIPYAGKDNREYPIVWEGARLRRRVVLLFREGLDTVAIADDLGLPEHDVANALAQARDATIARAA